MINPTLVFMKRIVLNGKLNRDKFTNNKKKFNTNMIIKRKIYSNTGPPEQGPDWILIAWLGLVGFCVAKVNGRK